MSKNKTFAVLGLGRYGMAIAQTLINNGFEVIAVDKDEDTVNNAASVLPLCTCADITDPEALKALDIGSVNTVIISMASNLEETIIATTICKELGVTNVIAKCSNDMHKKILIRVGADEAVIPEHEAGTQLAKKLIGPTLFEEFNLSDDVSIVDIQVPDKFVGKSLKEIALREKYGVNAIAIKKGNKLIIELDPNEKLDKTMEIVVIAHTNKIKTLMKNMK